MAQTVLDPNGQFQTAVPPDQTVFPPKRRCRPRSQMAPLTAAQQALVMDNERLAHWLARRAGCHCGRETVKDLTQTALLAMCRAASKFDSTLSDMIVLCRVALGLDPDPRGIFAAYAAPACKRAVRDEMNERLGVISLPRHLFRKGGADHPYQVHAARARRVGRLIGDDDPALAQVSTDDHLDAEALLAWLDPSDRDLITANMGGESLRSIARRQGHSQMTVVREFGRILSELRGRASR